jgi:LacI family transcriptional regulator, repressor for deo operon, udp, cdd, tsx, nupC, and nupG
VTPRRLRLPAGTGKGDRMPSNGRVTIHDVASEASVSIATVSRVLNGGSTVNEAMAQKVRAAADRLGYRPNAAAQGLASGAYRTIGVVVPDLGNPYFNDILKSAMTAASADGYRMIVSDSRGNLAEELSACRQQLPHVDGMLLLSARMPVKDLQELAAQRVPVVLVNRKDKHVDLPMVAADNYSATLELCRHLASFGHERVVYLAGPPSSWQNRERWRGIKAATSVGITAATVACDASIEAGYNSTDEALEHDSTAILAFNDLAAFGVITRLRELGLKVPKDISVTGFDDIEIARHVRPPLTTAVSPKVQLGQRAWLTLRAALRGEKIPRTEPIPSPVVIRKSTGRARA